MGTLQEIIDNVVRPNAERNDAEARFPREAIQALGAAGLLGLTVPTAFGGQGQGPRAAADTVTRLAEADASLAMVYLMHLSGTACIAAAPQTKETEAVLRDVAAGRHLTTLAFSESGSRSHFWAPVSQAHLNGGITVSAEKSFVTSAGEADSYVITTQRPGASNPTDTTLYLVRKDAKGLVTGAHWDGLGLRANASGPLSLRDVKVGDATRLTEEGQGFTAKLQTVLPLFNLGSAAVSLGISRAALAATAAHLKSATFEHMGQTLAEALPNLRANVAKMQIAVSGLEARIEATVQALEAPGDLTVLRVLEVKAAAAEVAIEVAALAMRTCGGAAFGRKLGLERSFRDAQAAAVMAPTTEVLHEFIGKAVLGLPLF